MNNTITHPGIIEQIEDGHLIVRIVQGSGCASCKMAGHCHASESTEKLVDIYNVDTTKYHVGENIVITADMKTGYRAVAWGFGVPLLILTATIFGIWAVTANEAWAALAGLAALIPYYAFLYLIRNKFRNEFSFGVE
ncbi:SoxR reducing system RseC family protein [Hallella bergensis]|uniref:SoxR reducing system RseC family protein n=1 Tax=Hallella bergensis TaxID=242750 RepID=UPI0023F50592|nr:SoxR reducing system RseC family protein [Hallella bergensis]